MVSFTPRSVYLHGNNLGYALDKRPKSVWKFWGRETAFPAGDQKLIPIYRLVCSIVTMPTELSRLQTIVLQCRCVVSLSRHHKVRSAWMKILIIVTPDTANTACRDIIHRRIKGKKSISLDLRLCHESRG
jgi:hypothetical protein